MGEGEGRRGWEGECELGREMRMGGKDAQARALAIYEREGG